MCNIPSAPHFIVSDMSDNDVPIGNVNVEEAAGRIKFLTVQLSILGIYIKKTQRERTNSDNINHQSALLSKLLKPKPEKTFWKIQTW